ncbi:Nif3-like dinuclear metal center hexameric protein [Hahella sp. CCB-MM4]|uniref:Nif3-like dinuclear metal center hexameric protein n=1 Tax=Hahella sp. (strain CCB-MM4) TaxID=1926491 RepID=UPI000B9AB20A|nr:Nif3-like dinuclear metal center hexameric protein [Hahella sp. CCB-MM4]OZG70527.1 Nif3-like dinuclear metal center hexameric protein [Hahella sp. CCB-MM4]
MVQREVLLNRLNEWLQPELVRDYCPNGLQVEGRNEIKRILCGVTATQALVDRAVEVNADAVLVHHGYFWKSENPSIVGMKKRRLATLLANDVNLIAYHLPLDIHPEFGNNAGLAKKLGLIVEGQHTAAGTPNLLWYGKLPNPMTVSQLNEHVSHCLSRAPLIVSGGRENLETVAWCTGGAQGFIDNAADLGVDVYISGEISEQTTHSAREQAVTYVAAGHHATERYGVQLLGEAIREEFGIVVDYFELSNPA